MKELRLEITPGMRRFLDYPKFRGRTRMLILGAQYFFDESWRRAGEQLGWQVEMAASAMTGGVPMDDIRELFVKLAEFKPDFVLASNFAGMDIANIFAHFFNDARIPYVSWFTDPPRMILFNREIVQSHYMVAATWEKAYTSHFTERGFENVFYMPLATDPTLFHGEPASDFGRGCAFVGNPMIELAEEALEKLAHLPRVLEAIHAGIDGGRIDRDSYVGGIEAMLDAEVLEGCGLSERRNIELAINYEATRRQRRELVEALEPQGIEAWGADRWEEVTQRFGGSVGYFDDLAPFYRTTAVNVNTTSVQMSTAANQRVFDCPAAGGFLITDAQSSLNELFDAPSELVTYESLDELKDKTAWYVARPEERERITRKTQERALAEHTHVNRLQDLEGYLRELYG